MIAASWSGATDSNSTKPARICWLSPFCLDYTTSSRRLVPATFEVREQGESGKEA
jgi:hypothetical protein